MTYAQDPLLVGRDLAAAELLAEPGDVRAPLWAACAYARVLLASRGGLFRGDAVDDAQRARLEEAGWFGVASDADVPAARAAAWPALASLRGVTYAVGSPAPRLVLVAERPGIHGPSRPLRSSSGGWLLRALRVLGHDELTILVTNAALGVERKPDPAHLLCLYEHTARYEPTWVALGAIAHDTLRRAKIEHAHAYHPAHARRFRHGEGHVGYAAHLAERGVPYGPWHERELPRAVAHDPAPLLRAADLPPTLSARRTDARVAAKKHQHVAPEKMARARELYVRGEATTLRHAAREARIPYRAVCEAARAQGWQAARERYLEEVRRRTDERAADVEAKAIAAARKLAWGGATQSLKSVLDRMRAGDLEPSPRDAKALVDAAITLHQLRAVALDDEQKRALRALPLPELARRLQREVEERFGPLEEG